MKGLRGMIRGAEVRTAHGKATLWAHDIRAKNPLQEKNRFGITFKWSEGATDTYCMN
jgi:hypothetical protein